MKSFLDHFRRKGAEESPGAPRKNSLKDETEGDGFATGLSISRKTRQAGDSKVQNGTPAPPPPPREFIKLQLKDFLPRIPPRLLRPGRHDGSLELEFDAEELADSIARGVTTISLLELHRRVPNIFLREVPELDTEAVRFPWQKVMNLVNAAGTSDSQLSKKTAETLAERLRGRKPSKMANHKEVEAIPVPVQAVAPSGESAKPRGSDSRQPTWFSKPQMFVPAPALTVLPNLPVPVPDLAPAVPLESSVPSADSEIEPPVPQKPDSAVPQVAPPTEMELPFAPAPIDETQMTEEAIRARDSAALQLARLKGEHERQVVAWQQERQALADARDHALAELERTRKQVDDKLDQIEFQKSVSAKTSESAARVSVERQALQNELHEKARVAEELQVQLDAFQQVSEERLAALTQERDALLQQKEHLTKQAAQFRGAKSHLAADPAAGEALSGPERSKKEYQRQIGELQRRIAAFENNQKEAAHELTKEREARIRVERTLSAAERARTEATALVESMRAETRRELEAGLRKREAEAARRETELQTQIDALTENNGSATAEQEALAARLEEAQRTLASEREKLGARVVQLEEAIATAAATPEDEEQWESRAIASLESDIENYRARIKALLQERDGWSKERERLAAGIAHPSDGVTDGFAAAHTELVIANEQLRTDLQAAVGERDRLAEQLRAYEQRLVKAEHAHARLDALTKERAESAGELTRVKALLAQIGADHQLHLSRLQERHDATLKEKASANNQLEEVAQAQAAELQSLAAVRAADQAEIVTLHTDIDRLTKDSATARAGFAQLHSEKEKLESELQTTSSTASAIVAQLQTEIERLTNERNQAREALELSATELQSTEKLASQLQAVRQESEIAKDELHGRNALLMRDLASVRDTENDLRAMVQELEKERDAELRTRNSAAAKFQAAKQAIEQELENTQRKGHAALSALRDEVDSLNRDRDTLASRHDDAITELRAEVERLTSERDAALKDNSLSTADLRAANERLARELETVEERARRAAQEFEREIKCLRSDREAMLDETEVLRSRSSALEKQVGRKSDDTNHLAVEREQLRQANERLAMELSNVAQDHAGQISMLQAEIDRLQSTHDTANAAIAQTRTDAEIQLTLMREQLRAAQDAAETNREAHERALRDAHEQREAADRFAMAKAQLETLHERQMSEIQQQQRTAAAYTTAAEQRLECALRDREELSSRIKSLEASLERASTTLQKQNEDIDRFRNEHRGELAALTAEQEDARQEIQAAKQLLARSIESERTVEALQTERDQLLAEAREIAAAPQAAQEARSGTLVRELKAVTAERDEALAAIASEHNAHEAKADALARERFVLQETETQLSARFELETARLRRERDTLLRQRDDLRERIEKMVGEQRELLEEIAGNSSRTTKARRPDSTPRTRGAKEVKVIDMTAAEVEVPADQDSNINLQRIRPVAVPPPQVRVL